MNENKLLQFIQGFNLPEWNKERMLWNNSSSIKNPLMNTRLNFILKNHDSLQSKSNEVQVLKKSTYPRNTCSFEYSAFL